MKTKAAKRYLLVYGATCAGDVASAKALKTKYDFATVEFPLEVMLMLKTRGTKLVSRVGLNRLYRQHKVLRKSSVQRDMEERFEFLHALKTLPFFRKACGMLADKSLTEVTDRVLALFRSAYHKQQGHPNADSASSGAGQMLVGLKFILALVHPANAGIAQPSQELGKCLYGDGEGGSWGESDKFDVTFTGEKMLAELERVVNKLTAKDLLIFQLARTMDHAIAKSKSRRLEHSLLPDGQMLPAKMNSFADINKLAPSAQALPEVLKNYRLGLKQHTIIDPKKPEGKKQVFYMLVDSSLSMDGKVEVNSYGLVKKCDVATALVLACIKKALEEKTVMWLRFFAGQPDGTLHSCESVDDFTHLSRMIALSNYNGGGTSITAALTKAFEDVQMGKDKIAKAEVLLLSDAEDDNVDEAVLKPLKRGSKLHVLEILRRTNQEGSAGKALEKLSDTFVKVNAGDVKLEQVVKAVTG